MTRTTPTAIKMLANNSPTTTRTRDRTFRRKATCKTRNSSSSDRSRLKIRHRSTKMTTTIHSTMWWQLPGKNQWCLRSRSTMKTIWMSVRTVAGSSTQRPMTNMWRSAKRFSRKKGRSSTPRLTGSSATSRCSCSTRASARRRKEVIINWKINKYRNRATLRNPSGRPSPRSSGPFSNRARARNSQPLKPYSFTHAVSSEQQPEQRPDSVLVLRQTIQRQGGAEAHPLLRAAAEEELNKTAG